MNPASSEPAIRVEELTHRYGDRVALGGVSFDVEPRELFGLLGPNGGGKTTLLHILATLIRPSAGRALVDGVDVAADPGSARRRIGVVFQSPSLDLQLTARENLRHHGHLYGLRGRALAEAADRSLDRMGVLDRADDRVKTLSGGLRRRVELAKGLLHHPAILLLDEPTVGLDPGARRDVWDHLAALGEQGVTAVVTTHLMGEAEACGRVAILDRGTMVAMGSPAALMGEIRGDVIALEAGEPSRLAASVRERFGIEAAVVDGAVRIERRGGAELVPRLAEAFPGEIRSITVGKPTLEDVFVQRTGRRFWQPAEPGGPAS